MKSKQIIMIIVALFTTALVYKYFTTQIQANKEKQIIEAQLSKEKQIIEINKEEEKNKTENTLIDKAFQKRQECATYKSKVLNDLRVMEENERSRTAEENAKGRPYYLSSEKKWPLDINVYYQLGELFYSPKADSCLFVSTRVVTLDGEESSYSYSLSDVFIGADNPLFMAFEDKDYLDKNYDIEMKLVQDFREKVATYKLSN